MVDLHGLMVGLLLAVLLLNIFVPPILKNSIEKMVFWTRIGYFAFWMFWSMNIFAGLIVFMFTGREFTVSVAAMSAVALIMGVMDGYRAIYIGRLWRRGLDAQKFSMTIIAIEILLLMSVSLYAYQG